MTIPRPNTGMVKPIFVVILYGFLGFMSRHYFKNTQKTVIFSPVLGIFAQRQDSANLPAPPAMQKECDFREISALACLVRHVMTLYSYEEN